MKLELLRLHPGDDLKSTLDRWTTEKKITAACIVSGIGSLTKAMIRFADVPEAATINGPLEILTLQGTLSLHGSHIHISVSDKDGKVIGGHLKEGSIVRTTAEIALLISDEWTLERKLDEKTGYLEMNVTKN